MIISQFNKQNKLYSCTIPRSAVSYQPFSKTSVAVQNFDLKIMSTVVNDTVGTMVSCAFDHPGTSMGLIVGKPGS